MVYGIDRAVLFGALALLIGGVVFLVAVWPRGRDDRRAARVVWAGWIGVAVTTVLGIALEGVYAAGLPLTKVFDPTRVPRRPRHPLRARSRWCGSALLVVAFPLLRLLLHRRDDGQEHPRARVVDGRRRPRRRSGSR